ncbi:MAG: DUF3617 domain-containing protein [Undibacterium sp.]|nr:DUF3617 domain-containing protein [Undibacterium sp.]
MKSVLIYFKGLFCVLALIATHSVMAQIMKPGLWEMKQSLPADPKQKAAMEEMEKQMAKVPPEQRKMIEQMRDQAMAKAGVSMNINAGIVTIKMCITKEQAELNELHTMGDKAQCTHKNTRSGTVLHSQFVCTKPDMHGESTTTFNSNEAFSSEVKMVINLAGKMEEKKMSSLGRWLGTDCGDIKPYNANTNLPVQKKP